MRPVKQKTQATAAFLGVWGFLRDVVGGCCIRTTILTRLEGLSGVDNCRGTPRAATAKRLESNSRRITRQQQSERAAAFPLRLFAKRSRLLTRRASGCRRRCPNRRSSSSGRELGLAQLGAGAGSAAGAGAGAGFGAAGLGGGLLRRALLLCRFLRCGLLGGLLRRFLGRLLRSLLGGLLCALLLFRRYGLLGFFRLLGLSLLLRLLRHRDHPPVAADQ